MASPDINTSWEKIRRNVKESEILIGQKKYNLSMVKARQALEGIVYSLCERGAIVEPDLASSIDALYSGRWISKTSCEHYHKIRMMGNKAVHEGSDDAYEANQVYHLISQEAYTYSHEYINSRKSRPASAQSQAPAQPRRRPPSGSSGNRSRRRRQQGGLAFSSYDVARLVFLSLVVVLIIVLIVLFKKPKETETEATEPTSTIAVDETTPSVPETTITPETMAPTTASPVYKTSDNLNVRSQPSTEGNKLATLPSGTVVEYVGEYDSEWSIIIYNNEEAYVSSQYLVHD